MAFCLFWLIGRSPKFPSVLKIAKVIPLFKSGNKLDCSNYRPISFLPVISKICERILKTSMVSFLEKFSLLLSKEFGSRETKHCRSIYRYNWKKNRINNSNKIKSIWTFLDSKKAFDAVDHKLLVQKCADYGLRRPVFAILQVYLSSGTQFVIAAAKTSILQNIDTGVSPGSVLGPLLFLIYINDLRDETSDTQITLFADDTSVLQNYKPDTGILIANEK